MMKLLQNLTPKVDKKCYELCHSPLKNSEETPQPFQLCLFLGAEFYLHLYHHKSLLKPASERRFGHEQVCTTLSNPDYVISPLLQTDASHIVVCTRELHQQACYGDPPFIAMIYS